MLTKVLEERIILSLNSVSHHQISKKYGNDIHEINGQQQMEMLALTSMVYS